MLVSMALIGLVVFLIGDERQLFAQKTAYRAVFEDVEGLKRGSPVRMGGMDVGTVEDVSYGEDPKDARLLVKLSIVALEARRIRQDSRIRIDAKGLLGDKMITISVGSSEQPPIPVGGTIPTDKGGKDLQSALSKVGSIATKVEQVVTNLETTTGQFADKDLHANLKSSADSLSDVLGAAAHGDGYVARLLNDRNEAARLSHTLASLERTSAQLERTLSVVANVAERVEKGPGLAHELLYGESSAQTVAQMGHAADELALTLAGIRTGNGLAKAALFGDDSSQQLSGRMEALLRDLSAIVADVRAGKGTVGALLADPSVYEDLKVVLGNVERNRGLRALVRYSIQQQEPKRSVEVRDPAPAASAASKP